MRVCLHAWGYVCPCGCARVFVFLRLCARAHAHARVPDVLGPSICYSFSSAGCTTDHRASPPLLGLRLLLVLLPLRPFLRGTRAFVHARKCVCTWPWAIALPRLLHLPSVDHWPKHRGRSIVADASWSIEHRHLQSPPHGDMVQEAERKRQTEEQDRQHHATDGRLPDGWIAQRDGSSGHTFYANTKTGDRRRGLTLMCSAALLLEGRRDVVDIAHSGAVSQAVERRAGRRAEAGR